MKKLIAVFLALTLLLSLGACSQEEGDGGDDGDIIIGHIAPLTGDDAIYGLVSRNAIEMAVEDVNAAGGVAGHKVVLKVYDDRGDSIETVNCARKAILEDKCVAIICASNTGGNIAVDAVLSEYKVPNLAFALGAEQITHDEKGNTKPYEFRTNTCASQCTTLIGRYTAEVLGIKKAAIFYDMASSTGADGVTYFTQGIESGGGTIVEVEAYKSGDVDFRAQLSTLKTNGGFDAIYSAATYNQLGLIANQIKEIGLETQLIGDRSWMMLDVFDVAGDNLEGAFFPSDIDYYDERFDEFNNRFIERTGQHPGAAVGTDAYMAYDCCQILWNAIEHAVADTGKITGETIRDAIEKYSQNIECLTGVISIDPETHNVRRDMSIFEIRDQQFVCIDTYRVDFG